MWLVYKLELYKKVIMLYINYFEDKLLNNKFIIKNILIILLILITIIPIYAGENQDKQDQDNEAVFGFIFSTQNLLFDIGSYQGGIGLKLKNFDLEAFMFDFRGLIGFLMVNLDYLELSLGIALEFHFIQDRISPYWGIFLNCGLSRFRNEVDSDNWNEEIIMSISTGPILGVEVFILENLSVFAEYNISCEFFNEFETVSTAGNETKNERFDLYIDTLLGNSSKLGIVIYINPVVEIKDK